MPTVQRERGYVFYFRAADRGEPPHVHVIGNGGRAKIWLVPVWIATNRGYSGRQLGQILDLAETHKHEWIAAWSDFFAP